MKRVFWGMESKKEERGECVQAEREKRRELSQELVRAREGEKLN